MKKNLLFFVLVISVFFSQKSMAQCSENLKTAQANFEDGHFYGIPALLEKCLKNGFSKENKIDAYRLLTLTYLYIDDPISAENSFIALLDESPEYRVDTTDVELVHLSKQFITTPIISWRARGGVNFSNVSTIHVNGAYNLNENNEVYKSGTGYSIIGSLDIHLNKNISFSLESDLSYNVFNYENKVFFKDGVANSKDIITLKEKSYNISLPISVSYTVYAKKYYPYVYAGYSPGYNVLTNTNAKYVKKDEVGELPTEDNNLGLSPIRNDFMHAAILGIGLKRRFNLNYVFIDVRYKMGLSNRLNRENQNNFESELSINKYTLTYMQQDNDFRQNELNITIGYVWPQYNTRERKSVTAKSFIGNMFKKKKKDE